MKKCGHDNKNYKKCHRNGYNFEFYYCFAQFQVCTSRGILFLGVTEIKLTKNIKIRMYVVHVKLIHFSVFFAGQSTSLQ